MENRLSHAPPPVGSLTLDQNGFRTSVQKLTEETLKNLDAIWAQCGYEDIECQGLRGDLYTKVKALFSTEVLSEQKILDHAKEQVIAKRSHLVNLYAQLGRTVPAESNSGVTNYADKLNELEKGILLISEEVDKRQDTITLALRDVEAAANELGEPIPSISEYNIPAGTPELSDVRLEAFIAHKSKLDAMKHQRVEEMKSIAIDCYKSIVDLCIEEEGGYKSKSEQTSFGDIDSKIISFARTAEFKFGVGRSDMNSLISRCQSLYDEKESRRNELAKSGSEIARLWTLLRISSAEREAFTSSFKMNLSMNTVVRGRQELDRLKEVRVLSLGRVVGSIRSEIEALWRECAIDTEEQRREEFESFYTPIENLHDEAVSLCRISVVIIIIIIIINYCLYILFIYMCMLFMKTILIY